MEIKKSFWKNKNVLITGHTGFKGTWLSLWLDYLGANISGFSLAPTKKNFFFNSIKNQINLKNNIYGDIRNKKKVNDLFNYLKPEIIIHMAAQPLVGESYINPITNYETNINGTINILNATKNLNSVKALINVTTDKCYRNDDKKISFSESDPLGGYDPYSSSKACSEIITSAFYKSFLKDKTGVATVRAGNVIGGGDWSDDRLIPDIVRALKDKKNLVVRNCDATRPWQFVLEPLKGYILLCERVYKKPLDYSEAWNFGPNQKSNITVNEIINKISKSWGKELIVNNKKKSNYHESKLLMLDSRKSIRRLNWKTKLDINQSIDFTINWYKAWINKEELYLYSINQIKKYEKNEKKNK